MANSELNWTAVLAGSAERELSEVLAAAIEALVSVAGRSEGRQPLSSALEQWLASSQAAGGGTAEETEAAPPVSAALEQLLAADQTRVRAITENMTAVVKSTTRAAAGEGGGGGTAKSVVSTLFGSALAATPLIGGLVKLFGGGGGGSETTTATYNVYTPPQPLEFEGAVDREAGIPNWSVPEPAGRGRAQTVTMPQVTVQVSAMDSQSFLDHSDEIARAVRQAMLNSHGLNDVISEL